MSSPLSRSGSIRYVEVVRPGGPDEMHLTEGALPPLGPDDVRIHVEAAGVTTRIFSSVPASTQCRARRRRYSGSKSPVTFPALAIALHGCGASARKCAHW